MYSCSILYNRSYMLLYIFYMYLCGNYYIYLNTYLDIVPIYNMYTNISMYIISYSQIQMIQYLNILLKYRTI